MPFSARTDIGRKRTINQDGFCVGDVEKGSVLWAVVCDGMGGMAAGNIASQETVSVISSSFRGNLSPKTTPKIICNLLKSAVEAANAKVYDMAQKNEAYRGMGTTVVALIVKDNIAYFAHVGDSRAYLLKGEEIFQLTTDHSIVQTMVESGQITADEAKHHPNKNIITRAVGVASGIDIDFLEIPVEKGEILLLCTDGLTNCLEDSFILQMAKQTPFEELADRLVDAANEKGGPDNITVAAVRL